MIFNYTNEKYEPLVYSMSLLFSFSTGSVNQTISRNQGMQYCSTVAKTKGLHIYISNFLILYVLLDNMYILCVAKITSLKSLRLRKLLD